MRFFPVRLSALLVLLVACDEAGDPAGIESDLADPVRASAFERPALGDLLQHPGPYPAAGPVAAGLPLFAAPLEGGTVVYDAIPNPLPGSYPSLGYQATRTHEWGDLIELTEAGMLGQVTVGLNSWACENDDTRTSTEACVTTPGATFPHPITINLYEVDRSGTDPALGALIASRTETFDIPFRPSWDEACFPPTANAPFGGQWFDPVLGKCVNGFAVEVAFDFVGDGVELPQELIFGVAFDTESAGASPLGVPGPYNSLNLGAAGTGTAPPPSVGTNVEDDYTFWSTDLANWYCDGGADGVGVFRRDGCWGTITPMVRIELGGAVDDEGPVASAVVVVESAEVGQTLEVSAMIDDTETGGSNVVSAEVQVVPGGEAPADDGWSEASASDGAFDSPTEAVDAELAAPDGAGLFELCVRGTDEAGNTGAPACAPLAVVDPGAGWVTGGGWWDESGDRASLGLQAQYQPTNGRLMANVQLEVASVGLRLHVKDFGWLVVTDDTAVLSGRARLGTAEVQVLLTVGDGSGPDGEDTVEVVVREAGEGGGVLYETDGPQSLGGGSIQIHR